MEIKAVMFFAHAGVTNQSLYTRFSQTARWQLKGSKTGVLVR